MRLLDLQLIAYGPFRDRVLDFSDRPLALHVIYGPNEAGKSTALRAVSGLLFGIPRQTPDAHVHRPTDLRIGARLQDEDGQVLAVVRKKGNLATLLDPQGNPIEEAAIERLLHGIGRELFETTFGLDHARLAKGAEALLAGKGSAGESLFAAGLGASALHQLLVSLGEQAEAIFTPQAKVRPLNEAIRRFREAKEKVREKGLVAAAWEKQTAEIAAHRSRRAALEEEARALKAGEHRLRRAERVLPLLARRQALAGERATLGDVVLLSPGAPGERADAERDAVEAAAAIDRLGRELELLAAQKAALSVPEALLAEQTAIEGLRDRLASEQRKAGELPGQKGEREGLAEDLRAILARLGAAPDLEAAERLRVDVATAARIRALGQQGATLAERRRGLSGRTRERKRLKQERQRLESLPEAGDARALASACEAIQLEADLEGRIAGLGAEIAALEAAARNRQQRLGLAAGPLDSLPRLPLPALAAVGEHEEAGRRLERDGERLAEEEAAVAARRREIEVRIDASERIGPLPSEPELVAARARRDALFARVARALAGEDVGADLAGHPGAPPGDELALAPLYAASVRQADEIADRLRRETERVAELARLTAERDGCGRDEKRLAGRRLELHQRREQAGAAWRALWLPPGIEPGLPATMRAWLEDALQLVARVEEVARRASEQAALHERAARVRADLGRVLAAAGTSPPAADEGLASALLRARQAIEEIDRTRRAREDCARRVAELEEQVAALDHEKEAVDGESAVWRASWSAAMRGIGLGEEATAEEAEAVIAELTRLAERLEGWRRLGARIAEAEHESGRFAEDVARLVAAHAPELAALPPARASAQLEERYRQGREDAVKRSEIERRIEEKRRLLADEQGRASGASARLQALLATAGVDQVPLLVLAETRSARAREIDLRLAETEEQIGEAGGGAGAAALDGEFAGLDPDRVRVDLEETERRSAEIEEERRALSDQIFSLEVGLGTVEGSGSADAAAEAEEALAQARQLAEHYLRLKLAARLLGREIDRYRKRNEGPVLARASEVFARLTRGSFSSLRIDFDERGQPVLLGVRADGTRTDDVAAMSGGTRDQLYLALRLASIERHLQTAAPLPLVVDDIQIEFDDDRSRAALVLLGELSERTQVLFFTHHARMVELAEEAVSKERLRVHRLD